jgi:hypothetical protein
MNKKKKQGRADPRSQISGGGMVRSFIRSTDFDTVLTSGVTVNSYDQALGIALNILPGYAEFTSLFDQYRIMMVEVTFYSPYVTIQATATPKLMLHTVNDYDDYTAVTPTAMQEYETYQQRDLSFGKPIHFSFKPRVALAAYSGAFTSYANQGNQWLDVASPAVQHYGLKYALEMVFSTGGRNTNVLMNWATCVRTCVKYHLQFRTVR